MKRSAAGFAVHFAFLAAVGAPAIGAAAPIAAPAVDHHMHLISPAFADIINGPPLLPIAVPTEFAALLEARAAAWNDREALRRLFADDAIVAIDQEPKTGLFRGADLAARFLGDRFARGYRLTPVAVTGGGELATIAGYYTRGTGAERVRIGAFHLALVKRADGAWRIAAEIPSFPAQAPQPPVLADALVAALDEAGIRRGVVLSTAAGIGGRWLDIYRETKSPAERHAQVRAENDWTAAQAARFPDRLVAFCSVNPLEPYALEESRRCGTSGLFRGLKLHFDESGVNLLDPGHAERTRQVFAEANRLRLPIVVHVGNNEGTDEENRQSVKILFDRLIKAAPDVAVQIAHLWGGSGFSESALAAYAGRVEEDRAGSTNVYFDVAESALIASQYGEGGPAILSKIANAIRRIGVSRILFGSDGLGKGHFAPREAWLQFTRDVPLSDPEMQAIAGNIAPYLR